MDIFRLPKFSFYFYQSQAGPKPTSNGFNKPMLAIANYWNDEKQKTVKIFSNCDKVELLLNGKSLGIQKPDTDANSKNLPHAPFTFNPSEYHAGTLTAIGYIGGKKVITKTQSTPGDAYKIVLKTDVSGEALVAGKGDEIFVYAYITDKNGTIIPGAANPVKFSVEGGSIVGPAEIKAEAGIATILLKGGDKPGNISLKANSEGLRGTSYMVNTLNAQK